MWRKTQYYFWIVEAFLKRHLIRFTALGFFAAFIAYILATSIPRFIQAMEEDIYIEGIIGAYTREHLPPEVLQYISIGLVSIDKQGNPTPTLASGYEIKNEGKTYEFRIRNDIYWHNSTQLTTNDLAYNMPDVIVEKPEEHLLVFKLQEPVAAFPTLLTSPIYKITPDRRILGVGEYQVDDINYKGTQYIDSMLLSGQNHQKSPKKILIKFFPNTQEAINAFKVGKVHGLKLDSRASLENWNNTTFYKRTIPRRFIGIFFNLGDKSVGGKSPQLRQALAYALAPIEEEETFIGPYSRFSWAQQLDKNKYSNDKQQSLKLLDEYFKNQESKELTITLTTTPEYLSLAEKVKNSWGEVGILTEIRVVDQPSADFQALLISQDLPSDPDQYSLWHSTQEQTNFTKYSNLRVDRDLELGRKSVELEKRLEYYQDFQKIIMEELPVIYLHHDSEYYAVMKKYDSETFRELKGFK